MILKGHMLSEITQQKNVLVSIVLEIKTSIWTQNNDYSNIGGESRICTSGTKSEFDKKKKKKEN